MRRNTSRKYLFRPYEIIAINLPEPNEGVKRLSSTSRRESKESFCAEITI
jgi:hypothetical protein